MSDGAAAARSPCGSAPSATRRAAPPCRREGIAVPRTWRRSSCSSRSSASSRSLYTAYVSLTDRDLLASEWSFIGLDNYAALMRDEYFWHAVVNTIGIWVLSTIPSSRWRS